MCRKVIVLFFLILFIEKVYCTINIYPQKNNILKFDNPWTFSLNNSENTQILCILNIHVENEGRIIYDAHSKPFYIYVGMSEVILDPASDLIINNPSEINPNEIKSLDVEYSITDVNEIERYGIYKENIIYTDGNTSTNEKFEVHGVLDMQGLYNIGDSVAFMFPNNYFRVNTQSKWSVIGVPFTFDAFISTEQRNSQQQINFYKWGFDKEAFKDNMIKKTRKLISNKLQQSSTKDNDWMEKIINIDDINNIEELKQNVGSLEEINNYNILYDNLSTQLHSTSYNQLQQIAREHLETLDSVSINYYIDDVNTENPFSNIEQKFTNSIDSAKNVQLSKAKNIEKLVKEYHIKDVDSYKKQLEEFLEIDVNKFVELKESTLKYTDQIKRLKDSISDEQYMERLYDKEFAFQLLDKKLHLYNRVEKYLGSIEALQFGVFSPSYSKYNFNTYIRGYEIGNKYKGWFYHHSFGKKMNTQSIASDSLSQNEKLLLSSIEIGHESKKGDLLSCSYVSAFSKQNLGKQKEIVNHNIIGNYLFVSKNNPIKIEGEYIGTLLINRNNNNQNWGNSITNKISYANKKVLFRNAFHFVDANYYNLFQNNIIRNQMEMSNDIFWNRKSWQYRVGYLWTKNIFSRIDSSNIPNQVHSLQTSLRYTYKNWYQLDITYSPAFVKNTIESGQIQRQWINNVTLQNRFNYKIKNSKFITSVHFSNEYTYRNDYNVSDFGTIIVAYNNFIYNQNLRLGINQTIRHQKVVSQDFSVFFLKNMASDSVYYKNNINFNYQVTAMIKNKLQLSYDNRLTASFQSAFQYTQRVLIKYWFKKYLCLYINLSEGLNRSKDDITMISKKHQFNILSGLQFKM